MNNPAQTPVPGSNASERVGDLLKQARESRGLTVEAIAKELKLNDRYILALEASDYDRLPGDTYIRVYLRSLCVFLALNPEDILQRFFNERGLSGVDTLRKDSSTKINLTAVPEKEKPGPMLYLILGLIAVLVVFSFFANRQGWFASVPAHNEAEETSAQSEKQENALENSTPDLPAPEVIVRPKGAAKKDGIDSVQRTLSPQKLPADSASVAKKTATAVLAKDSTRLSPKKTADSASKHGGPQSLKDTIAHKATAPKDSIAAAKMAGAKPSQHDTTKPLQKTAKDTSTQRSTPDKTKKDSVAAQQPVHKDTSKPAQSVGKPKKDSVTTTQPPLDSLKSGVKPRPKDTAKKTATVTADTGRTRAAAPDTTVQNAPQGVKTMKLRVTAKNDSTWVTVYRDGIRSRNMFHKGRSMYFIARDSFNVVVDANENATISLDGAPLSLPGTGKVSIKVNARGEVSAWTPGQ